jgi:hypothetical protein
MDVVDKIKAVKTGNKGFHQNVPKEDVIIERAESHLSRAVPCRPSMEPRASSPTCTCGRAARPDPALRHLPRRHRRFANVDTLFILGDLFEYWIGDDDLTDPFNADVCALLRGTATWVRASVSSPAIATS